MGMVYVHRDCRCPLNHYKVTCHQKCGYAVVPCIGLIKSQKLTFFVVTRLFLQTAVEQRNELHGVARVRVAITSLAVDPNQPHMFATAGSDVFGESVLHCH